MKISRSNYEIWFTDWLDGNLSPSQVEEFEIFLSENPDLREEFTGLSEFNLKPLSSPFPLKEQMKKPERELSHAQFEILCAAWFEKDLSGEQQTDLLEMIDSDPEKRKAFDLIGKMRIVPPAIQFRNKKKLLRRTTTAILIRMSLTGLSAAAVLAVVLMTGVLKQRVQPGTITNVAETVSKVSNEKTEPDLPARIPVDPQSGSKSTSNVPSVARLKPVEKAAGIREEHTPVVTRTPLKIEKIAFHVTPVISENQAVDSLVPTIIEPGFDEYDDRSRIGKFIAQTFRDKILKEDTHEDTPLKGYEIAEAGIEGLNKLFGWEMALTRNNDENGELKSLYFSSRTIKFNAPVKNIEQSQ
jgi:hypothetical protein